VIAEPPLEEGNNQERVKEVEVIALLERLRGTLGAARGVVNEPIKYSL
jgi:hypothetical protein